MREGVVGLGGLMWRMILLVLFVPVFGVVVGVVVGVVAGEEKVDVRGNEWPT